jgi:hypothetical protein
VAVVETFGLHVEAVDVHTAVAPMSLVEKYQRDADPDGHYVTFQVAFMAGHSVVDVQVRCDADPRAAAALLRKLADRLEDVGGLLRLPPGAGGRFDTRGRLVLDGD